MPDISQTDHKTSPEPTDNIDDLVAIDLEQFAPNVSTPDSRMLKNLALVLTARDIPCWQIPTKKPQEIRVRCRDVRSAEHEITLYLEENQKRPLAPERFTRQSDNSLQTISALLLIAVFHNITYLDLSGFGQTPIDWLQHGRADADLIRAGEWWRTITALTLHADAEHLIGNLLIGGYFVIRVCRLLGGGLGWSLILWSGIFGNIINAWMHTDGHRSVGASTALFGAIGVAGMIGLMRQQRNKSRYWLLPVAAATGLLAMLGAGGADTATDIGAHLFGFASGLSLGAISGWLILQYGLPSAKTDRILATIALLMPVCAWLLALTGK